MVQLTYLCIKIIYTNYLFKLYINYCLFQVGFLSCTNLEKRLRAVDKLLERMEGTVETPKAKLLNCPETIKASETSCEYSAETEFESGLAQSQI